VGEHDWRAARRACAAARGAAGAAGASCRAHVRRDRAATRGDRLALPRCPAPLYLISFISYRYSSYLFRLAVVLRHHFTAQQNTRSAWPAWFTARGRRLYGGTAARTGAAVAATTGASLRSPVACLWPYASRPHAGAGERRLAPHLHIYDIDSALFLAWRRGAWRTRGGINNRL